MQTLRIRRLGLAATALALAAFSVGATSAAAASNQQTSKQSASNKQSATKMHGQLLHGSSKFWLADQTILIKSVQTGTISEISEAGVTVTSADGHAATYLPVDTSRISRDGDPASVADLVVGDATAVVASSDGAVVVVDSITARSTATKPLHVRLPEKLAKARNSQLLWQTSTLQLRDGSYVTIEQISGKVTAIDGSSVSVMLADGSELSFTPDSNSKLLRNHRRCALSELAVGDKVQVTTNAIGELTTVAMIQATSGSKATAGKAKQGTVKQ